MKYPLISYIFTFSSLFFAFPQQAIFPFFFQQTKKYELFDYEEIRDLHHIKAIFGNEEKWMGNGSSFHAHNYTAVKVLYDNNTFAGFIAYKFNTYGSTRNGYIAYLGVSRLSKHKGYGRFLLTYACQELTKLGAQEISLETRVDNEPAVKLYQQLGFKSDNWVNMVKTI